MFRLGRRGLILDEIAPGVDIDEDILALLRFTPDMAGPGIMDPTLFIAPSLGLRKRMLDVRIEDRLAYDAETNTVFMDYAGMHVRTPQDVEHIVAAVDGLLEPLGRRVHSIVNYDRFVLDEDAVDAYAEAVRYVSEKYYESVSRHTTSGFVCLKLARELAARQLDPSLYDTEDEAKRNLHR